MVVVFRFWAINANPSASTHSPRVFAKKPVTSGSEHRLRPPLPAQPAGWTVLQEPGFGFEKPGFSYVR
jgi:hypothetical protein